VAGIGNKNGDFSKGIEEWDIVIFSETWVEGKRWEKVISELPKGYSWEVQMIGRKNRRIRAIGGMMGVKKGIEIVEHKERVGEEEEIMKVIRLQGRKNEE